MFNETPELSGALRYVVCYVVTSRWIHQLSWFFFLVHFYWYSNINSYQISNNPYKNIFNCLKLYIAIQNYFFSSVITACTITLYFTKICFLSLIIELRNIWMDKNRNVVSWIRKNIEVKHLWCLSKIFSFFFFHSYFLEGFCVNNASNESRELFKFLRWKRPIDSKLHRRNLLDGKKTWCNYLPKTFSNLDSHVYAYIYI